MTVGTVSSYVSYCTRRLYQTKQCTHPGAVYQLYIITFRVRHSRGEMYIGRDRLCVCLCVRVSVARRIPTLLHRPGCNSEEW